MTQTATLLLRKQDRLRLLALLAQHLPGVKARAFGSRVTGQAHEASDLDLALISPNAQAISTHQLEQFRQAVNDSNHPILVDARDWAMLPKSFHTEIEKAYVDLS